MTSKNGDIGRAAPPNVAAPGWSDGVDVRLAPTTLGKLRHVLGELHDGLEGRPEDALVRRALALLGELETDDSARGRHEEALRASEARFRLLSRVTSDAIWDWDLVTDELWWSEGFETLFGYSRDDVENSIASWTSRVHPDDVDATVQSVQRAIHDGKPSWTGEYRYRRKDGSYAWVLDRGWVICDEGGTPTRMIGGLADLTARRETERQLRRQARLIDEARDAILVRDLEGRVVYLNARAESLYGWTAAEAKGRDVREMQFACALEEFDRANDEVIARGEWQGELRQVRRDGTELLVEGRWTLVPGEEGEPATVLAINSDISERKLLEERVFRSQRLESIGTLAGGIAHDLNNVLAPILASIAMLKLDESDPERLEDLTTIERSAYRGAQMVGQLLSFARGAGGVHEEVDVSRLVQEVARVARDTFPKSIQVRMALVDRPWWVSADPTQMHQVLMNLCVNARDAMPRGGRLDVKVANVVLDEMYAQMNPQVVPGRYVVVQVEDTGEGMTREVFDRMFEPFFTTKPVGKGTGLGLSTAHTIVREHGGFIDACSEVGVGTTVCVYLPAIDSERDDRASDEVKRPSFGGGELVLVVDDEPAIRTMVKRTLERFGYRVLLAAHGAEAIATYANASERIDVVLTDMAMPVMDGPATIIALQAIDPSVRIVASSGLDDGARAALGARVKHFIAKPYTGQALLDILYTAIHG